MILFVSIHYHVFMLFRLSGAAFNASSPSRGGTQEVPVAVQRTSFGRASYRCPLECLIQALTVVASKVGFL